MSRTPFAIVCVLSIVTTVACRRSEPAPPAAASVGARLIARTSQPAPPSAQPTSQPTPPSTQPATTPPPSAVASAPLTFVNATVDQDRMLDVLGDAATLRFRPVGRSSIVFRATLQADFDAAFKADSQKHPRAHAAEVASYRLARLLGLDNVPPATTRRFDSEFIKSRMIPPSAWSDLRDQLGASTGQITGASIYWIADLQESGLDNGAGTARYTAWLKHDGAITDNERPLARDVSNMVAFDCLIGNWDRWSGGNVKSNADGTRLYIRDHDGAFPGRLSEELQRRILDRLTPVERFSKSFVQRLRQLTRASFEAELAHDPDGTSLVDNRQLNGMLDRREALLSHIDALMAEHGEDKVLVFP